MPGIQLMAVNGTESPMAISEQLENKSSKIESVMAAFSSYMQQSSANNAGVSVNQQDVPQPAAVKSANGNVQNDYEQYQSRTGARAEQVSDAAQSPEKEAAVSSETVQEAVEEIKNIIEEELDIDESQLEAVMELLGLTQTDLLIPQNLIQLTTELTGNQDTGMMLFDANFQNILQQTTEVTQDLLKELGMNMEELMTRLNPQPVEEVPELTQAPEFTQTLENTEVLPNVQPQAVETAAPIEREEPAFRQTIDSVKETPQPQQAAELPRERPEAEADTGKGEVKPVTEETVGQRQEAFEEEDQTGQAPQQEQQMETPFHSMVHQGTEAPVQNLQPAQNNVAAPVPQIDVQNVIEQIVEYSRTTITDAVKSIEMQLNPENLGKIYLHISEKEGVVTAQITAQNENLKEALVQQAAILRDNLNQQGVKVQAVEVSVGTHAFENNLERDAHQQEEQARQQEEQAGRRGRRSIDLNDLDDLSGLMSEEEALVAQIMRDNGNNVDYKA